MLCSKSQFTIILGDFNVISPEWWSEDILTLHGTKIDSLTTTHGFKQLISDLTHILPQSFSCPDFNFYVSTQLYNWLCAHPSLHPNCQHKITFCKLNLKLQYPSPYQRLVWNFKKSNDDAIKRSYWVSELKLSLFK